MYAVRVRVVVMMITGLRVCVCLVSLLLTVCCWWCRCRRRWFGYGSNSDTLISTYARNQVVCPSCSHHSSLAGQCGLHG